MKKLDKSVRESSCKPEWKIILNHLVFQDEMMIYRICRKMIIYLDRMRVFEIHKLMEELNPSSYNHENLQNYDSNWAKPKGSPFIPEDIINKVFQIADHYLPDEEITKYLTLWINQENVSFLSRILERRHAPLAEVIDTVRKFTKMTKRGTLITDSEKTGVSVSLISRFLTENLHYINIAKDYIDLDAIDFILDHTVGPASGNGKLGGKSAGLILAFQILTQKKKLNPILENVKTPKSWFITSDAIMEFVHHNALEEFVFTKYQSFEEIRQEYTFVEYIFKNSPFPPETIYAFSTILDDLAGKPIIIRSSSLLEDSFEASFSGKYKSLFFANIGTKAERMAALMNTIAEVYASTFGPDPIEYRRERGLLDFREEMGILVQEVVGTKIGKYFLPSYAGVAFSYNEFRWSQRIERSDGIVRLVTGLGTRAVDRTMNDYPRLVSPGKPGLKVNTSLQDQIRYSQQYVDLINLEKNTFETVEFSKLIEEAKGYFPALEKIVSFDRGDALVEPVSSLSDFSKERLVISFNNLIDKSNFIVQIKEILKDLQEAFQVPVDIEFASDGENLYLLQCRPQSEAEKEELVKIPVNINRNSVIFSSNLFVSNGLVKDIEYVVYVDSYGYFDLPSIDDMNAIGRIISRLNKILPKRKFILIGPGRWGSKGDVKLGVPVIYSDINNTAMLIEVAWEKAGYVPELSFGTHFFQDLVEAKIKYLPLYPDQPDNIFNKNFFSESDNHLSGILKDARKYENIVRVIRVSDKSINGKLTVYMDGDACKAIAVINNNTTIKHV
jgi:hypothetical protein